MHVLLQFQQSILLIIQLNLINQIKIKVTSPIHNIHIFIMEYQRCLHPTNGDVIQFDGAGWVTADSVYFGFVGV